MRVLLLKPRPTAAQFGLAPFFQTEPLGLEYIAAALMPAGHRVRIVDFRFERRPLSRILNEFRPDVAGIACLHILDVPETLALARRIKQHDRAIFVAVGGHAAGAYPQALDGAESVDAIGVGEGERTMPSLCEAIARKRPLHDTPSLLLRGVDGGFRATSGAQDWLDLRQVRLPERGLVARYQSQYCCLNYMPVWTIETARGCPHRCKFCSVWQFYGGSCRFHAPETVRADFETTGRHVFVIDDLFWSNRQQSEELADALLRSPERKAWMLVQSRADLVGQNPDLLRLWRPLASKFDIFFGFESPTYEGLRSLHKGTDIAKTLVAIQTARELGYGVTGNFIIDPDYTEEDFALLWDFLDAHQLYRVGFTILTPLPGTEFFEQSREKLQVLDWDQYDLHHLLWQPRLPVERFFELYCETWKRTVLNAAGRKKWWKWVAEVEIRHVGRMLRILRRTQRMLDPSVYMAETRIPLRAGREEYGRRLAD